MRHTALSNFRREGCQTSSRMWMDLCSNSYYKAAVSSHAEDLDTATPKTDLETHI